MIKAVLFDFRDTLLDVKQGYQACNLLLQQFVNQYNSIDPDKLQSDFKESISEVIAETKNNNTHIHNWNALFLLNLFKKLGINLTPSEFNDFLEKYDMEFAKKCHLYPDAHKLLDQLKERGIKMGVIIDGTSKRERMIIKNLSLEKYFDTISISEEVGHNKFTDEPLKEALSEINTPPSEVLVVGDRLDKDIIHANKLGCTSIKLERHQGRYTDTTAISDQEKPKHLINSLDKLTAYLNR